MRGQTLKVCEGIVSSNKSIETDEINWSVPYDILRETIAIMNRHMTINIPGWPVPLECGLEVGYNWGTCFAFNFDPATNTFVPDYVEVKPETLKEELPEPEEEDVDLSDFYYEEDAPLDE